MSAPDTLTSSEQAAFPIVFAIDFNWQAIDRLAGFWEAIGLNCKVLTTGAGYALVLYAPNSPPLNTEH